MYQDLNGKRVVVTGGASGIGFATVERFISEGARVVVFDIDESALAAAKKELPEIAGTFVVDVSNPESVEKAFNGVDDLFGGLDVLISNAGISVRKKFLDVDYSQWSKVMRINLDGMFLCSQQAARRMEKQGSGVILMTASTNGTEGHPFYTDYNCSKAGVILLTKSMALELAPIVRVNCICPGYVLTPMQRSEYTDEMLAVVNENIPMKRHADPSEVAGLFAFLASEQARYITGADIAIDGGETAGLA